MLITRTYLRSKTKHYTVKVKKIYYYDPKKPSPVPGRLNRVFKKDLNKKLDFL